MTRDEHIQWAKDRAEKYIEAGDWQDAWASFACDLNAHEDTRNHAGLETGMRMVMVGLISNCPSMWNHIKGYN